MQRQKLLLSLGMTVAVLMAACDKKPADPPTPQTQGIPAVTSNTSGDTSVPSAESALATASSTARADTTATRTNSSMSRAEESAAMPMAGQSNGHSAPLAAKSASAP